MLYLNPDAEDVGTPGITPEPPLTGGSQGSSGEDTAGILRGRSAWRDMFQHPRDSCSIWILGSGNYCGNREKEKRPPGVFLGDVRRECRTVALSLVWNPTSDRTAAGEDRASWALPCETPEKNGGPGSPGAVGGRGARAQHQLFNVKRLVFAHVLETQV